jgi:hypothetical protein
MPALTFIVKLLLRQECVFVGEAEERIRQVARRWNIKPSHFAAPVSLSCFLYSNTLNADRLGAVRTVRSIIHFDQPLTLDRFTVQRAAVVI